jgi:hypothetical protein
LLSPFGLWFMGVWIHSSNGYLTFFKMGFQNVLFVEFLCAISFHINIFSSILLLLFFFSLLLLWLSFLAIAFPFWTHVYGVWIHSSNGYLSSSKWSLKMCFWWSFSLQSHFSLSILGLVH